MKKIIPIGYGLLILVLILNIYFQVNSSQDIEIKYVTNPQTPNFTNVNDLTQLYEEISGSIVSITTYRFIDDNQYIREGSGFFISKNHVVTNNHVVEQADSIEIELKSGDRKLVEFIGGDVYADLAILKIDEHLNVTPLMLGNSSAILPGTPLAALGNPFGLKGSITSGILSAQGRLLKTKDEFLIVNVLQTDAPINPGNSGGPLVTFDGLVVGVNIAKEGDNVGFAVPSNAVDKITRVLIKGDEYEHPWVGFISQPVTRRLAEKLGLEDAKGLQIIQINEGGPADTAGLQGSDRLKQVEKEKFLTGGDIITHLNGEEINSFQDLMNFLENTIVGENITVKYIREKNMLETTLIIGKRPL